MFETQAKKYMSTRRINILNYTHELFMHEVV